MSTAGAEANAGPATLPPASTEQEAVVTDILFREQTVDCNPWVEYSSRAVQTVLPPILFYRYVDWTRLLGWELLWFIAMAWRIGMAAVYRRRYPPPRRPGNARLWWLNRNLYQAYGWFVVGLVGLFCFVPGAIEWEIAAVAGLGMVFTVAPSYSHERSEVVVSAIAMPLPVIAMLIYRATPLHYALAALMAGIVTTLAIWGVQQVGARRNEVRLRLALQEETRRAEAANLAKSRFLAAASHDLRQPLHALALFVEALKTELRQTPLRGLIHNIERSVHALDDLFNALLDISKLDAGTVVPQHRHVALAPLLARLDSEFGPQARAKGLAWQSAESHVVAYTDPVLLETVLRNLISNAIRYTRTGAVHLTVDAADERLQIAVRDTGIGIPASQQQEVFREFHQLHNPERDRSKGLGLGLAIVDRLTRLLGVELALESTPGTGSCFTLGVPRGDAHALPAESPRTEPPDPLAGRRVVVVDDEADIREGMHALLTGWGCVALVAESGDEAAVRAAQGNGVDLVIADYRLRDGRTGAEAIARIRDTAGPTLPAIIVTGDTAPERLRDAAAAGFLLLHKPVRPHKLRAAMLHLLRTGGDVNQGNSE